MKEIQNNLIVSCQALEDEPLHSSYIMSKMALAAKMGGAKGIRANSVEDIRAIKKEVEEMIISNRFSYLDVVKYLQELGIEISIGSVWRYAKRMKG